MDRVEFKKLFLLHAESLRNFLYYKTGNQEWAEDIMQEAFMELWKSRQKVNPEKARSFLFSVANNRFLDAVRHQKVILKHREQLPPDRDGETPEHILEQEEFRKRLEDAIQDLPERQRTAFLMNRIEKMKYREIAEAMGISVKAVEKLMHKALSRMRKINKNI